MSDDHHFENLPVLLILEIRDRNYMFYRRTYIRYQIFHKSITSKLGFVPM